VPNAAAKGLDPAQRRRLSLEALAGPAPIADLARQHHVSRKFVYRQAAKASDALERAFAAEGQDDRVLLHLPITKTWIRQFVLELALLCHRPFRAITEVLDDLFGYAPRAISRLRRPSAPPTGGSVSSITARQNASRYAVRESG
jgi:hypothetical protein